MPFDPALPVNGTPLVAAEMRSQLQALKALIDAILTVTAAQVDGVTTLNPGDAATASVSVTGNTLHFQFGLPPGNDGVPGTSGNDGAPGAQGPPFANAVVDGVTTLDPGDAATASVTFDGTNVHFTFGLPSGIEGLQGPPGADGADGAPGMDGTNGSDGAPGAQGPPFANAVVDGVTTLAPGSSGTVGVSFDGSNVHFTFAIPGGADGTNGLNGTNGTDGINGTDGAQGPQGPPGEVSAAQLTTAIMSTSANTNSVATLDAAFTNDPPTLVDIELLRAKVNELILNGRR